MSQASSRITRQDVDRIAETISESLRGLDVRAQGRNGYIGLDLCDARGVVETLHCGTKREVYTYLQGMRRALLITNRRINSLLAENEAGHLSAADVVGDLYEQGWGSAS